MEKKKYTFFRHEACEFFPCHETKDPENFNCLFCFCPLYCLGEKCGGAYSYTEQGYKDCSACMFPHKRENYDKIMERFGEISEVIRKP